MFSRSVAGRPFLASFFSESVIFDARDATTDRHNYIYIRIYQYIRIYANDSPATGRRLPDLAKPSRPVKMEWLPGARVALGTTGRLFAARARLQIDFSQKLDTKIADL
eukprot:COSAG05_NODE_2246_length_3345_cov_5.452671_5_plen_108_part_00